MLAPQTGRSQIEKEGFQRQVEGVIMNTDINQEVIVGGDINGHVGQVANGFHETHEKHIYKILSTNAELTLYKINRNFIYYNI